MRQRDKHVDLTIPTLFYGNLHIFLQKGGKGSGTLLTMLNKGNTPNVGQL